MATTIEPTAPTATDAPRIRYRLRSRRWLYAQEGVFQTILFGCGILSVFVTLSIAVLLARESIRFFEFPDVSLKEFFLHFKWSPLLGSQKHFGIWSLVNGTFLVTFVAMLVALPLGLITAVYLSEYSPRKLRAVLKPTLEILAGIPTVVYGFFALTMITPWLQSLKIGVDFHNALSGGIAVGILILPTIVSLSEDALQAVPRSLREAAYGLGGTRFDVAVRVVTPAALSGIISASLLAIARAVGETMIVALACGLMPLREPTLDPRHQSETMTGWMAQLAFGEVSAQSVEYYSIYAVAAMLFLITLGLTLIGNQIRRRFREAYQ